MTVWTTPDETHAAFQTLRTRRDVALARQPDGDLGARMLAALKAAGGPALVIGTDCPAMMPAHLRMAADVLRGGADAVVCPGRGRRLCADRPAQAPARAVRRHALEHRAT